MILYFLQGVALALPSTVSPSPFKIFLISHSLVNGWRATLPAVLAPLITDGPIIVVALFLLNRIPLWYLNGLHIVGGLFILTIAARFIRLLRSDHPTLQTSDQAARQSFKQAVGINVLNPNPYLLWGIVAGPIVLDAWQQQSPAVGLSFIVGFYLAFVLGLTGLVLVFGTAGKLNPRANRILNATATIALIALGVYQVILGFQGVARG